MSLCARAVRPAEEPRVTGVLHREGSSLSREGLCRREACGLVMGLGVRSLRRDFTYSDSNWKSSEGGEGGSSWRERAEDRVRRAVMLLLRCQIHLD
jgi:hypothetical protein